MKISNHKFGYIHSFSIITFLYITSFTALAQPIHEEKFVSIGGIEQWMTIHGADRTKPVVLFIHGGPGSVMSPYSKAMYGAWEKDFVLVNWDQRGAGRTFGRSAPEEVDENYWLENPLTLDQMVADGIEITQYLLGNLGKQKVIIAGTSWGSILGAKMALKQPELFQAYLGHAQFVSYNENLKFAYQEVYKLAKNANDQASIEKLNAVGKPPYTDARNLGQMLRIVKKYESERSAPAPDNWWKVAPEYDNEKDSRDRYNGDDYSFLYFAGHEKLGIQPMAEEVDFHRDGLTFQIPVFFIQGEHDILTSKELNKAYFEKLSAPEKAYFLVPDAGHSHNRAVVDRQYQILKERVVK